MKRLLSIVILPVALFAQASGVGQIWTTVTGTLQSGATANGNGTALAVGGLSSVVYTVNCSVACSGGTAINFEVTQDGTNYVAMNAVQVGTATIATTVVNQGTTITLWQHPIGGVTSIRARISGYSAGTITVTATASAAPWDPKATNANLFMAGTATDGNSGNKSAQTQRVVLATDQPALANKLLVTPDANSAVNAAQVNGATVLTGNGVTGTGSQRVTIASDNTAFSVNANAGTNLNTSALALESGGNLATVAGAVRAEDTASADAQTGIGALAIRKATPANTSGTDGDYEFLQVSAGRLWTSANIDQINGVTPLMGAGNTGTGSPRVTIASDQAAIPVTATLGTETTKVIGTVRAVGNAGGAFDAATGAAPPANAMFLGGLKSGATGGLVSGVAVCDLDANVNISTATTTLVVTGVSGRQVRICAINLVNAAADNVALIEGTGATCGTGTAGMAGGTTAATGWNFAANGGLTLGHGMGEVMTTATTGDSVCIATSAATQLSGHLKYTIY